MTADMRGLRSISNNRRRWSHDDGGPMEGNIKVQDRHGWRRCCDGVASLLGSLA